MSGYYSTVTSECSQLAGPSTRGIFARSVTRPALRRRLPHSYFATTVRARGAPHFVSLKLLAGAAAGAAGAPPPPSPPRGHHLHRCFLAASQTGDLAKKPQSRVTA